MANGRDRTYVELDMKDLSELSDEELLRLTSPLADNDYIEINCKKCGAKVIVRRRQLATKYCQECANKMEYSRPRKKTKPSWRSGTLGERWKWEHTL